MAEKGLCKSDRRIRAAFIDLLEEKGFYQIRVADILSRADVSRATFYTHYEDKYQLMRVLREEQFNGLGAIMEKVRRTRRTDGILHWTGGTNPIFVEYFRYIQENQRLWKLFASGRGEGDFSDALSHYLYHWISQTQELWSEDGDPELTQELSSVICSWVYVALFSKWLTTGMKETPEEMAKALTVFWTRFMRWDQNE